MKTPHSLSWARKSVYSALVFFGTLIVLSVGYAAWNAAMGKVSSGNPLTVTGWNALVDNIADLDSRWSRVGSNIVFTGGNVGIGTSSPGGKLDIAGTTLTNFLKVDSDRTNTNSYFSIGSYWSDGVIRMNPGSASTIYINREVGVTRDLSIWNGNSTSIFYTQGATGNVGIGTTTPGAGLHISRASNLNSDSAVTHLKLSAPSDTRELAAGYDTVNDNAYIQAMQEGNGYKYLALNPRGGNVGIGISTPSYTLQVNGSVAGNSWTASSDRRFKKNITPLSSALDTVEKLQGVSFDWRVGEFKDRHFPSGKQVGFIAQEVEKVIPEVVTTDKQGYKGVEYANITAVLVEAVKEQQKQIAALQEEVRALKNK